MKNLAIFASGSGSNAENIFKHLKNNTEINISLIVTNNKNAFVIQRAKKLNIPYQIITKSKFSQADLVLDILKKYKTDIIVLAGFLLLIPEYLIEKYRIINIHPALLPNYGGKGMYGNNVHKAVIENKEKKSGITIHYVNNKYDEGEIIFQASCTITNEDTFETLAEKIHKLEYKHFPHIIEKVASSIDK